MSVMDPGTMGFPLLLHALACSGSFALLYGLTCLGPLLFALDFFQLGPPLSMRSLM